MSYGVDKICLLLSMHRPLIMIMTIPLAAKGWEVKTGNVFCEICYAKGDALTRQKDKFFTREERQSYCIVATYNIQTCFKHDSDTV